MPTNTSEPWEERFADKFSVMLERSNYDDYQIEEVYSFIASVESATIERTVREIHQYFKDGNWMSGDIIKEYAQSKNINLED